ncbi:MAG: hypothetical protein KC983_07820, partial [Phycisphaerales bacterium]|nr:hypothetical protein [Phycisphaerales bacterium]
GRTTESVSADLRCLSCGYTLRGRSEHDCCTECGEPVRLSLGSRSLSDSEPGWCRSLARGAILIALGMGLVLIIGFFTSMIVGASASTNIGNSGTLWIFNIAMLTMFVSLYVIGDWLFTAREPSDPHGDTLLTARNIARYCLIIDVVSTPIMSITQNPLVTVPQGATAGMMVVVLRLSNLSAFCGWFALGIHSQRIVRRAGLPTSAKLLRVAFTGYAISTMLTSMFGFIAMLSGMLKGGVNGMSSGAILVGLTACGMYAFTLLFGVLAAAVLLRAGLRIRRHAKAAQIRWDRLASAPTQPG